MLFLKTYVDFLNYIFKQQTEHPSPLLVQSSPKNAITQKIYLKTGEIYTSAVYDAHDV